MLQRSAMAGDLLTSRTAWGGVDGFSTPRSSSLRQGGYTTPQPAESVACEASGMERLATAWIRMHDRRMGRNVGVGSYGCAQSTETEARTGLYTKRTAAFAYRYTKKSKKGGGDESLTPARKESST